MKMKAKLMSESKEFLLPFWAVIFLCIVCSAVSLFLFKISFTRSLSKINEKPIAEITFKKKTAQRKFLNRNLWDRLREHSEIYDGDMIHTAALSEATIWFSDGNVMELQENTMVQVFLSKDESLLADFIEGEVAVDSSNSSKGAMFKTGNRNFSVSQGASVSVEGKSEDENISVLVSDGTVTMENGTVIESGASANIKEQTVKISELKLIQPSQNSKILYHEKGSCNVDFKWESKTSAKNSDSYILISKDKKFSNIISRLEISDLNEVSIMLDGGIYYWKIINGKYETPASKFQVVHSLLPVLVSPNDEMNFQFRKKNPLVRFIWTESAFALSYRFLVADNAELNNPVIDQTVSCNSAIISTLKEGNWWWTVEPFYKVNGLGYVKNSNTGCFRISKKGKLENPVLHIPADDSSVDISSKDNAIDFSWKNDSEAYSYRIVLSKNENLSDPIISEKVEMNFYRLPLDKTQIKEGRYWWSVASEDAEGNVSAFAKSRIFHAIRGKSEQHLIEPVRGFNISKSLLRDTKFSWKKNLGNDWTTKIIVSDDPSFSKIIWSDIPSGSSTFISNLNSGRYWWKIVSINKETKAVVETPEREFNVMDNIEKPEIMFPLEKVVVREKIQNEFKWSKIEEADFYRVTVYDYEDNKIIFDENVYGTSKKFSMYNSPVWVDKKRYRLTVQGKALAVPEVSTRRVGNVTERDFQMLMLRPVEIIEPAVNSDISGIDAISKKINAKWYAVDDVSYAQLVLYKVNGKERKVIMKSPTDKEFNDGKRIADETVLLDVQGGLQSGKYEIVVNCKTLDGIDISNNSPKNRGKFTVKPVEPLKAAAGLNVEPKVFDVSYVSRSGNQKKIKFHWNKVEEATDYYFRIYNAKNKSRILRELILTETEFILDFDKISIDEKRMFMNGEYIWTVGAVKRIDSDNDGKLDRILRPATFAKSIFVTSIPMPGSSKATGAENPYGR